ncbi:MAG: hypothetical protein ACOYL6_01485 [Bacteriovoracaceae bacterium]
MQFTLGFLKSAHQVMVKTVNLKEDRSEDKTIDIADIGDENLQILFYPEELENQDVMAVLAPYTKYFPLVKANLYQINEDVFKTLEVPASWKLSKEVMMRVLMKNNINTLREIFPLSTHLKNLWMKDRYAFFHEVWFLLRSNLGSPEVKILFHDVHEKESETEKHKLVLSKLEATNRANIEAAKGPEVELFKHYENKFEGRFQVAEYFADKGDLLLLCHIEKSPVMIMVKTFEFNQLQEAILSTLIKSL